MMLDAHIHLITMGLEDFIRRKQKALLSTRDPEALSEISGSMTNEEICSLLKNTAKNELSAILE